MTCLQYYFREFVVVFWNLTLICFEVQFFEVLFFSLNHFVENNGSFFHCSSSTNMDDAFHVHEQFFKLQILGLGDFGSS